MPADGLIWPDSIVYDFSNLMNVHEEFPVGLHLSHEIVRNHGVLDVGVRGEVLGNGRRRVALRAHLHGNADKAFVRKELLGLARNAYESAFCIECENNCAVVFANNDSPDTCITMEVDYSMASFIEAVYNLFDKKESVIAELRKLTDQLNASARNENAGECGSREEGAEDTSIRAEGVSGSGMQSKRAFVAAAKEDPGGVSDEDDDIIRRKKKPHKHRFLDSDDEA